MAWEGLPNPSNAFNATILGAQALVHASMGKRKKSSRKPQGPRKREPLGECSSISTDSDLTKLLETTFTCLFCHHDKSVSIRMDRKEGIAQLFCKVCDQRFQSKVNRMFQSPLSCGYAQRCCVNRLD